MRCDMSVSTRHGLLVAVAMLGCMVSACGESTEAASATTAVTAATFPSATATPLGISGGARLAVERCQAALGQFFAVQIDLDGTDERLKLASAECGDAKLQLDADNPDPGSTGSELALAVAGLEVSLGFAGQKLSSDEFDTDAQYTLQTAVDTFKAKAEALLSV
jgi:hypothetical protein